MIGISIIIPVYNAEKTILTTLKSIQKQILSSIEIIFVDDGSTDSTAEIIKNAIKQDSRISYYYQDNSGAGSARNYGLTKAIGKYIAFMDADDRYCANDNLKIMFDAAEQSNSMVCGGYIQFKDNRKNSIVDMHKMSNNKTVDYMNYQNISGFSRFIYNRLFLKDNNLYFPSYKVYEDPVFLLNVMIVAKQFKYVDIPTYFYTGTHQNYNMNLIKVKDFLKGIIDVFVIAEKYALNELYFKTYELLNSQACFYIERDFTMLDNELFYQLLYINSILRWDIINKYNSNNNILPILNYMRNLSMKYYKLSNNFLFKNYRSIRSKLRRRK